MASEPLLQEFIDSNPGELAKRLTDAFDQLLAEPDDIAVEEMKTKLEAILRERTDAVSQS